ncbi:hypothetical protein HQ560_19895 [bacterium]|nr:hypothetical protein [bacterium]
MTRAWTLALGLVLLASSCAPPDRAAREQEDRYPTWFADTPIRVDGRTDEPAWRRAYARCSGGGRDFGRMQTLWDGQYLYLAVSSRLNDRTPTNRILLKVFGGKRSLDMVVTSEGVHDRPVYCTSLRLPDASAIRRPNGVVCETAPARHSNPKCSRSDWIAEMRIDLSAIGAMGHEVTYELVREGTYLSPREGSKPEPFRARCRGRFDFEYREAAAPSANGDKSP